jgi:hypothetical protein
MFNPFGRAHLHTTDFNEYSTLSKRGFVAEGISGRIYDSPGQGLPCYRVYDSLRHKHFFTQIPSEYNDQALNLRASGFVGEGIDGFILNTQEPGTIPLYRLVWDMNLQFPYYSIYHWTTDQNEYNVLPSRGWTQQGIVGYVFPAPGPVSPTAAKESTAWAASIESGGPVVAVADPYGVGLAHARNEDGAENSSANPAIPGSVVTLFVTGAAAEPLEVAIGGHPAEIVSAENENGALAVRVKVPVEAAGPMATVTVKAGSAYSQIGVLVAIAAARE